MPAFFGGGFLFVNLVTALSEEPAPGWYPDLNAVPGLVALALMVAGALMPARSSVLDHYREACSVRKRTGNRTATP